MTRIIAATVAALVLAAPATTATKNGRVFGDLTFDQRYAAPNVTLLFHPYDPTTGITDTATTVSVTSKANGRWSVKLPLGSFWKIEIAPQTFECIANTCTLGIAGVWVGQKSTRLFETIIRGPR